jgi:nitrilase
MAKLAEPYIASVVQATPVFFNKAAILDQILSLTHDAVTEDKSRLILFPEVFIPGYPRGLSFGTVVGSRTEAGRELFLKYWEESIQIPGPETNQLANLAKQLKVWLCVGVTEKDSVSDTLFCTLVYFSPEGIIAGKHRKIKPTAAERIIWGEGSGDDLQLIDSSLGKIGGLVCWENYMPLARTALYAQGIEVYLAPTADCRETWQATLQHIALEGRCFVLGSNQYVAKSDIPGDLVNQLPDDYSGSSGGSVIINPLGKIIAGPLFNCEGRLSAEIDHREIIKGKMDFDPIGHYARPDIFQFKYSAKS